MGADALDEALPAAFDVISRVLASGSLRSGDPAPLTDALYRDWYCAVGEKPGLNAEDRDLCELLRTAHASSHRWEEGWHVAKVSRRGKVAVTRGRERRVLHVIDCLPEDGWGARIRPGDTVSVVARRDSETMNPGDYVTFSEPWHANRHPIVRVYWNAMPIGAPVLVHALSQALGDAFPYFLKCPRRPAEYDRRDALVLYLPRPDFAKAAEAIAATARRACDDLCDPVPHLTRKLCPGVSVADDPAARGESFGSSRCALVARGVLRCVDRGIEQPTDWVKSVRAVFSSEGIAPDRPWAEAADSPEYALP